MRVYHTRPLLQIVEGIEDFLDVRGRLGQGITAYIESVLREFPEQVVTLFNFHASANETLDYASTPIVYMPDEFAFSIDVEHLGRLAREVLIWTLPLDASIWETRHVPIAELRVGGQGELLAEDERAQLKKAMQEVWALPIRGKVFVLDEASLRSHAKKLGTPDAIRGVGGIVQKEVSPECDYFVTDRQEAAEAARRAGAKQVVDTLTATVMVGSRD